MCDAASFFYLNLYIKTMLFFLEPLRLFFAALCLFFSAIPPFYLCIILMRVVADWRILKMEAQFPTTTGCM